jgi:hypothetical protein
MCLTHANGDEEIQMMGTMNMARVQTDENDAPVAVLQALAPEFARAYATAISLMPDQKEAEAVLIRAIDSLAPNDLTASTLRNTVIRELVRAQISHGALQTEVGTVPGANTI